MLDLVDFDKSLNSLKEIISGETADCIGRSKKLNLAEDGNYIVTKVRWVKINGKDVLGKSEVLVELLNVQGPVLKLIMSPNELLSPP